MGTATSRSSKSENRTLLFKRKCGNGNRLARALTPYSQRRPRAMFRSIELRRCPCRPQGMRSPDGALSVGTNWASPFANSRSRKPSALQCFSQAWAAHVYDLSARHDGVYLKFSKALTRKLTVCCFCLHAERAEAGQVLIEVETVCKSKEAIAVLNQGVGEIRQRLLQSSCLNLSHWSNMPNCVGYGNNPQPIRGEGLGFVKQHDGFAMMISCPFRLYARCRGLGNFLTFQ